MKPLKKILPGRSEPAQLLVSLFGLFTGLVVVMGGLFIFSSIHKLLKEKELLSGDYIVVGKKAGILNTISGNAPGFTPEEIRELQKIEGIEKAAGFRAGDFRASVQLGGAAAGFTGQAFKTDIFLESVPDHFVDADPAIWHWTQGASIVPLIIPSDFVQLYNSAFAGSQGLPVIPEAILKSVDLDLTISGNGKTGDFRARIVGFSKRINTVLVPVSFMSYAGSNYGSPSPKAPSRVILHAKDPASPKLAAELVSKGYDLNEEKLRSSELNNVLQMLIGIVSAVGLLIVVLALLGFIQYNQLMAYRSAWEIQTLHYLGFTVRQLCIPYFKTISKALGFTTLLSTLCLVSGHTFLGYLFEKRGIELELPEVWWPVMAGVVISLLIGLISLWSVRLQVGKLAE